MPKSLKAIVARAFAPAIAERKFFLLFLFLLGYLVFYPYTDDTSPWNYYTFRLLGVAVTLLTVYAIRMRHGLIVFVLLLSIPAALQHMLVMRAEASAVPHRTIFLLLAICSLVFDVFVLVVIFRRVFAHDKPTAETIFGAICIYLMIGFTFASVYRAIAIFRPHAVFYLDPATNLHKFPEGFDFIYYSFGTMTSLGAAGMVAVLPEVRALSVIESMLGVLYLAVLVARLIGGYRETRASSENASGNPD
jgi:hypothetical protein